MSGSTFGKIFQLTTFGESHGPAIGGIIQGCPPGFNLDLNTVQQALDRRRPGQSSVVSPRNEKDQVTFLSGIYEGKTTGTPIGFTIPNIDYRSEDYNEIKDGFRPSHADYTYEQKYGIRDPRGGGRASARETACRVVAGAIAEQFLRSLGITFSVYVDQIGSIRLDKDDFFESREIELSPVRCPDEQISKAMVTLIEKIKDSGDTIGGSIRGIVQGVPKGLGEPVFDKLNALLGQALLSINAVKGVEFGSGFNSINMLGSEHNDSFTKDFRTVTNHSGGIQGGISNGMPISFRIAFKPVSTLMKSQETINSKGETIVLEPKGRHDACVVPRAVPIVQAMVSMVLFDAYLRNKGLSL